jgi:hypothetical protein
MKSLNNLIEDIYTNIQPICDGESLDLSEEQIDKFGEDMKNVLRNWSSPTVRDSRFTLRMSNVGKPLRQLWYDNKSEMDSSVTPITMIKFLYGHILPSPLTLGMKYQMSRKKLQLMMSKAIWTVRLMVKL